MHTQSKETQAGFTDDGGRHVQGRGHYHDTEQVGDDMAPHDAHVGGARGSCRLHKLLLFELQGLPAHITRHQRPGSDSQGDRDQHEARVPVWANDGDVGKNVIGAGAKDTREQNGEEQAGEGEHEIGEARQQLVDPAAKKACQHANRCRPCPASTCLRGADPGS